MWWRTFAFWRRSAPCSILGAPNLPWPNKASLATLILKHTPVDVRRLLWASPFSVRHLWPVFTCQNCEEQKSLNAAKEVQVNQHPPNKSCMHECARVCTFTNRNSSIPALTHAVSDGLSHEYVPEDTTNAKPHFQWMRIQKCQEKWYKNNSIYESCFTHHHTQLWQCLQTLLQYKQTGRWESLLQFHKALLLITKKH